MSVWEWERVSKTGICRVLRFPQYSDYSLYTGLRKNIVRIHCSSLVIPELKI